MKKHLNLLMLVLAAFALLQCASEPEVSPQGETDQATYANAYADQFLTVEVTALKAHPENANPEVVYMTLVGEGGKVSVNWGDGTIEKMLIGPGGHEISHVYDRAGNFKINISGDIKTITKFDAAYGYFKLNHIHFGGVTNLREVSLSLFATSPARINLSQNRLLESVRFVGLETTSDIILPSTNRIREMLIDGKNLLPTAVVDRIIARVFDSVKASPRGGIMTLHKNWEEASTSSEFVGPPSSYSINKLRILETQYRWTILPKP